MHSTDQHGRQEDSVTPEGPEVRRSADDLQFVVGHRLDSVNATSGRWAKKPPTGLSEFVTAAPHVVVEVSCKGKLLYWRFKTGWTMLVTYGMSGQLVNEEAATSMHSHAELCMTRPDGSWYRLYFDDPRRFGTLSFINGQSAFDKKLASLGPDMLQNPSVCVFAEALLSGNERTLAEALMDQRIVAGVGNYIKAESLFRAGLSPWRKTTELNAQDIISLHDKIVAVMQASYRDGGATIATYRNPDGTEGQAQRRFAVYRHKQCPLGHDIINEETLDKRTSWWCQTCQS